MNDSQEAHIDLQVMARQISLEHGFEPDFPSTVQKQLADIKVRPPLAVPSSKKVRDLIWSGAFQLAAFKSRGSKHQSAQSAAVQLWQSAATYVEAISRVPTRSRPQTRTIRRKSQLSGDYRSAVEQSRSRWHGGRASWRVRSSRTLQVPLRIAWRQTVSTSTPHDVPLPQRLSPD